MMTLLTTGEESIHFESALSAGSHHADWFASMLPDVITSFPSAAKAALESFEEAALPYRNSTGLSVGVKVDRALRRACRKSPERFQGINIIAARAF